MASTKKRICCPLFVIATLPLQAHLCLLIPLALSSRRKKNAQKSIKLSVYDHPQEEGFCASDVMVFSSKYKAK
ncbi:uncharacterized protein BT62DRAFT_3945 [Guyanagaster necrorhizus]|uniref:Uncharacterized protein n=1 Tax=Guyanagaster necrorhizus TaxID=856835 RepID=A0A9P8AYB5_9AGAR|nr:uncharacterized protein BT62DRAFT_3945 [Guyanagaster necrorhizus MCA 3950]KAG7452478.1 hypothetical protein BT62DRAFT_3945 [Guyanagaster necrorhizus MCA 3950]